MFWGVTPYGLSTLDSFHMNCVVVILYITNGPILVNNRQPITTISNECVNTISIDFTETLPF